MRIAIAKESIPFVTVLAVVSIAVGVWRPWVAAVPLVLLAFVLWFFRDPERSFDAPPGSVLSPADGRIVRVGEDRISVFLNVFNVHVCRSPVAGRVRSVVSTPGRFLAAFKDEASEHNERTTIALEGPDYRLDLVMVAGLIARRIVPWVAEGREVESGERVEIIRFGSRVDLRLPPGSRPTVKIGDRVRGGLSVIARLGGVD